MSQRLGTIAALDSTIEQGDGTLVPATYMPPGATLDIHVSVSAAGVELHALPCTLTRAGALELSRLLLAAVHQAREIGAGDSDDDAEVSRDPFIYNAPAKGPDKP